MNFNELLRCNYNRIVSCSSISVVRAFFPLRGHSLKNLFQVTSVCLKSFAISRVILENEIFTSLCLSHISKANDVLNYF